MANDASKQTGDVEYEFPPNVEANGAEDTPGRWFAAIIIVAFVIAGFIVYRTGTPEMRTAANDIMPAAATAPASIQSDPIAGPAILPEPVKKPVQ